MLLIVDTYFMKQDSSTYFEANSKFWKTEDFVF